MAFLSLASPFTTTNGSTTSTSISLSILTSKSNVGKPRNYNMAFRSVPCKASKDGSGEQYSSLGRFDRRDILVGLGGLYGATSLAGQPFTSSAAVSMPEPLMFPLVLDKKVTALVKRPKISRSKEEKAEKEEVLVVEGIEYDPQIVTKFDVYINDEDDDLTKPDKTEFAGSFMTVPHSQRDRNSKARGRLRFALTDLLEDLGADDDEYVAVTLVPKRGNVTVGGLKVDFISE